MRKNGPVTQRGHPLADDVILMSVTDDHARAARCHVPRGAPKFDFSAHDRFAPRPDMIARAVRG